MDLLEIIRKTKKDYSKYLIHFTKQSWEYTGQDKPEYDSFTDEVVMVPERRIVPAIDVLKNIVKNKKLVSKPTHGSNGIPVVSFSESPLQEILSLMKLPEWPGGRYQPYGILFKKDRLFKLGARPVIYQDKASNVFIKDIEELKHRHVTFDYPDIDFSWEREWVIKDDVDFDYDEIVILVKTFEDVAVLKDSVQGLINVMPLSILLDHF